MYHLLSRSTTNQQCCCWFLRLLSTHTTGVSLRRRYRGGFLPFPVSFAANCACPLTDSRYAPRGLHTLFLQLLTDDNRVVAAPVKENASLRRSTTVNLVSLGAGKRKKLGGRTAIHTSHGAHHMALCTHVPDSVSCA